MTSFFSKAIDLHSKLHEHVYARRTNAVDKGPRQGLPIDVSIRFLAASNIPKLDPGANGLADPYFIANIDGKISYVSSAQNNTLNPAWNELWCIANVPSDAKMRVDVYDKDEGSLNDDYVGSFTVGLKNGAYMETLVGLLSPDRGQFGFQINSSPCKNSTLPQYSFDGPIRFSRHFSPTAGVFMKIQNPNGSTSRLWSTWKIALKGIPVFFQNNYQHWNVKYKAAQTIFQGPLSFTVRAPIQAGHRMLYARTTSSTFGTISDSEGFWALFRAGDDRLPSDPLAAQKVQVQHQRIKPAVYTYVIGEDDNFRFSETGASFFVDFASKHALHSCCAENVRYSGEFHPRPVYPDDSGWASFSEDVSDDSVTWELVIDNNSGTYSPDKKLLGALKSLLEYNFTGLRVVVMDYKDDEEALDKSRKACRAYSLNSRGVPANQLQPSKTMVEQSGELSLFGAASSKPAEAILGLGRKQEESTSSALNGPGAGEMSGPPLVKPTPEGGSFPNDQQYQQLHQYVPQQQPPVPQPLSPSHYAQYQATAPIQPPEMYSSGYPQQPTANYGPAAQPPPPLQYGGLPPQANHDQFLTSPPMQPNAQSGGMPSAAAQAYPQAPAAPNTTFPGVPNEPPPDYDQGDYGSKGSMPQARIWQPPPQPW